MTNPLDNSDLASLILADWHEEYGDIDFANEVRESVLEPKINSWNWSDETGFGTVVGGALDSRVGCVSSDGGSGVSSSGGVGGSDGGWDGVGGTGGVGR